MDPYAGHTEARPSSIEDECSWSIAKELARSEECRRVLLRREGDRKLTS